MRRRPVVVLAVVVMAALVNVVAACGNDAGDTAGSSGAGSSDSSRLGTVERPRLIEIEMSDFAFTPDHITATAGETVTLRFTNVGTVRHEAVIGSQQVQDVHAKEMADWYATSVPPQTASLVAPRRASLVAPAVAHRHPGMSAPNVVSVEVGATGEVTYSLAKPTQLLIGCHEPQHYEHGMVATLDVQPAR